MKKAIKIFAVIAVVCAFCLMAVACNHKDASDHTATGDWLSDATHHWHACENEKCGDAGDKAEHVFANACDADCDICGATRTPSAHVYDNGCDTTCNVCGDTRTTQHVFDQEVVDSKYLKESTILTTTYYKSCLCGEKGTETFDVDNNHTHDYSAEYSKNETSHWFECECGAKTGEEEHKPATAFFTDATHHWKECACGQVLPKVAHHYSQEVPSPDFFVEETDTAHVYHMSCICGAADTETFEVAKTVAILENVQMPAFITYGDNYEVNYATNSDGEVAIIWYKGNKQLLEKPTDVGFNYYVQVIIAGTTEYTPVESDLIPFEINPRVISGFGTNLIYDGSNVRRIDISYVHPGVELEVTFDGAGVGANVAGVKVFENDDESSNYIVDMGTFNVVIIPASVRVQWTAPADLSFDGTAKEPTATLEGVLPGDECYVQISLDGDNVWYGSTFRYTANMLDGIDAGNYALPLNGSTCTSPEYTITIHETAEVGTAVSVGAASYYDAEAPYEMYFDIDLEAGFYCFDYLPESQGVSYIFEIYEKGELYSPIATYEADEYSGKSTAFEITSDGSYYVKAVTSDETQYEELTIVKDEHTEIDAYGFCTSGCGTYLGKDLDTNAWETITISSGDKVYYRFEDAGDVAYNIAYYTGNGSDGSGLTIKCYRTDNEGNYEAVSLSESASEFVGSFDGYYYLTISFSKLGGGEKTFTFQVEQTT